MDKIECKKCGFNSPVTNRFCPKCGNQFFLDLDSKDIKDKDFMDIYNSIFTLISDKTNPNRAKYLTERSEKALWKMIDDYHKQYWTNVSMMRTMFEGLGNFVEFDLSSLMMLFATYILCGYAFKLAEEIKSGKTNDKLTSKEVDEIIKTYLASNKREDNPSRLELFVTSLTGQELFLKYALLNKKYTNEMFNKLVSWEFQNNLEMVLGITQNSCYIRVMHNLIYLFNKLENYVNPN